MRLTLSSALAALTVSLVPVQGFAGDLNDIDTIQYNDGTIFSDLDIEVEEVDGDLEATSAAIANSFSAELGGDSRIDIEQRAISEVVGVLYVDADDISDDVDLTVAAIANSASVRVEKADFANVVSSQKRGEATDPFAELTFHGSDLDRVDTTAAAIANSLSVTTLPSGLETRVKSFQSNRANVSAQAELNLYNTESVTATAAALGNSLSINNLSSN